jgi:hypothetical protein
MASLLARTPPPKVLGEPPVTVAEIITDIRIRLAALSGLTTTRRR